MHLTVQVQFEGLPGGHLGLNPHMQHQTADIHKRCASFLGSRPGQSSLAEHLVGDGHGVSRRFSAGLGIKACEMSANTKSDALAMQKPTKLLAGILSLDQREKRVAHSAGQLGPATSGHRGPFWATRLARSHD